MPFTLGRNAAIVAVPSTDPFYGPVTEIPPAGELIRSRPVAVVHEAVRSAWQIVYASTGARNQPIAVSGTVLLPTRPWRGVGEQPILTFGVGVHGLSRDAAPSYLMAAGAEPELELVAGALGLGWAVLVSDGDGLGMPGPHTYGAGRPGGHALLDIVRAAPILMPQLSTTAPVVVWGYSEGGRNAAWAAELQPDYAPDLRLVGVAAGGVPSDLKKVAEHINGGPFSGLGLAVLVGLAHAHRDPALLAILNPEGRRAAERAADADVVGLIMGHPQQMEQHTVRTRPWDEPMISTLLAAERNGRQRPGAPMFVYHVADDQLVPTELGHALVRDYRAAGGDVEWLLLDAPDHLTGAAAGARPALRWLAGKVARAARPAA